ncbi:hypothetical protein [Albidovulum sediminis]|uniref:DUF4153 domain-containing protein n=1 Tax=Albidovulum sediminis TaxID=3066345 RepID=A0ABT2NRE1_9RHOB|nr:hypothetical protein [Defluviimonas sediminis]MCT8331502.1 hypothetical protein [Defluviimonas sediminis]
MSNAPHPYDQSIADWMANRSSEDAFNPVEHLGFLRRATEDGLVRAGLSGTAFAAEMALFDAAAMRVFAGKSAPEAARPSPPKPATPNPAAPEPDPSEMAALTAEYETTLRQWTSEVLDPHFREGANPADRLKALHGLIAQARKAAEDKLARLGKSPRASAQELAAFDAAGRRLAEAEQQGWQEKVTRWRAHRRLNLRQRLVLLWISTAMGVAAFGLMAAILRPLWEIRQLELANLVSVAAAVGACVLIAAMLRIADAMRARWSLWIWFILAYAMSGLVVVLAQWVHLAAEGLGADYIALAWPAAGVAGALMAGLSVGVIRRYWRGLSPARLRADGESSLAFELLLVALVVLVFQIGARVLLGWGPGPSFVAGLFVAGLMVRLVPDREISVLFVPAVAAPLGLLAAEMPASGLSVITILAFALVAGMVTHLACRLARARRSTFFSSLTAAALALILVVAPTDPAPATRGAEWLGHPLRPAAHALMRGYDLLYRETPLRPVLSAVSGFRSGKASARLLGLTQDPVNRSILATVEILNLGERGIDKVAIELGKAALLQAGCGPARAEVSLSPPLWPGDSRRLTVRAEYPETCPASDDPDVAHTLEAQLPGQGRDASLRVLVMSTRPNDPAARFRTDARAWLGL